MDKAMKKLNSNQVARIRKPGLHRIERSFFIKVRPGGSRQYVQRLIIGGKPRDIGLGGADVVTLDEARAAALQNRTLLAQGINPLAQKAETAKAVAVSVCPTFADLEKVAFENKSAGWKAASRTKKVWQSAMGAYVLPAIGNKPIDQIEGQDVLAVLRPLYLDKRDMAVKVRGFMAAVFDLAISRGLVTVSPVGKQLDAELPAKQKGERSHHAAMPWQDVPGFITALRQSSATLVSRMALEFVILSGCRVNEVMKMEWSEVQDDIWTIPASRMKAGREHRIPITSRMAEILERMGSHTSGPYVFARKGGKAATGQHLLSITKALAGDAATVHGFRSSFRDWAGDTGKAPELAEAQLAHRLGAVERAYARSDLMQRRRDLMEAWTDFCTSAPRGRVVQLRRA